MTKLPNLALTGRMKTHRGLIAMALSFAAVVRARQRTRHALARLDDHMLRDIGLDRTQAETECSRRFWQD